MKTSSNNNNIESMRQQIATAISSNETIAKHVERIEIQEYCVYVYVDTRRASEKAMKQVQTSNRHLFAYVNYFKGKGVSVPYICYDLTGKAYNAIKREDKAEEKARREREALEAVEREKAEKQARKDTALALSWEREDKGLPIGEGEFALLRGIEGYVIGETEDGCLVFRNEGDTWTETQPLSQFARIMREKPEWVRKGQTVKFEGWLFEIETEDALGEDHDVFIRKQGEEPKCPKRYRKSVLMVRYETLTPCTPDGRELLPEPPAEVIIDMEPTFFDEQSGKAERESASKITEQREQNDAGISFAESQRDSTNGQISDNLESRKRTIIARAKEGKQAWRLYNGYEVRVRKAYTNGSKEPENWTYCVSWYADGQLVECENGVRLEQAARALNDLPRWAEARKAA